MMKIIDSASSSIYTLPNIIITQLSLRGVATQQSRQYRAKSLGFVGNTRCLRDLTVYLVRLFLKRSNQISVTALLLISITLEVEP